MGSGRSGSEETRDHLPALLLLRGNAKACEQVTRVLYFSFMPTDRVELELEMLSIIWGQVCGSICAYVSPHTSRGRTIRKRKNREDKRYQVPRLWHDMLLSEEQ